MQNLSIKAKEQIASFKLIVQQNGLVADSILQKEYNYEFNVTESKSKVKVLLYFGKKGLKLILQGDTNSTLYKTVENLLNDQQTLELGQKEIEEPDDYIGTDEVGKGDLFGPLVIAAVRADKSIQSKLQKIGVRDSKDLSDYQIEIIAKKIFDVCSNNISIISFIPEKYNKLYEKEKNLNKLLSFGHSEAIKNLLDSTKAGVVISDKFGNKGLNIHQDKNYSHINFIETEKAERFAAVAAASIIARYEFVNWFYEQNINGFDFPKGASDKVKIYLEKFIQKHGMKELHKFAKLHFKTIKNI